MAFIGWRIVTATLQRETTAVGRVVRDTVAAYALRHEAVVESWLAEMAGAPITDALGFASCVVAIDRRIVEVVLTPSTELSGLSSAIWRLTSSGWQVTILAPRMRLGEAHRSLRGTPCVIQPWWIDDGDRVAFGRIELT
jgi:hypothetical protein